jgi:malic enzyme
MEEQLERVRVQFESRASNIDKYIYLSSLQDRNEKLFYKFVSQNIEQTAPIVYTPTVGLACQKFGTIFRRPRSVFYLHVIIMKYKNAIEVKVLHEYTWHVFVEVFTLPSMIWDMSTTLCATGQKL